MLRQVPRLRIFKIKYKGPTTHKGPRITIRDEWYQEDFRIISYNHNEKGDYLDKAIRFLLEKGIPVDFQAWKRGGDYDYLLTTDLTTRMNGESDESTH